MQKRFSLLFTLIIVLIVQSCKIADLQTSELNPDLPHREDKAIQLLDGVIKKYRLDILETSKNYSFKAKDDWKGLYAIANPFPKDNELMQIRFRPFSFDGQFNYLETRNKTIYGVQSFKHYRINEEGKVSFRRKKSISFTLPAIQYFFELPLRLRNAPILKYAGVRDFENKTYDLVFATWDKLKPHKEHDQYLLYIDRESGNLSFASYTVRGMYLPVPKSVFGSIRFNGLNKNENGVTYPEKLYIQLNKLKKPKRALHTITISDLRLNSFPLPLLYPDKNIQYKGDSKF
ncbi:hypothetical protein ACOKFD_13830 [Flagellimonas sp. S174]|uniref:hypothetical protein n=1 Tax=Flagellimonas sp. S174 TaxID=3410790 RepID=UPI003BF5F843